MRTDVLILGAGIIGVATAIHLQQRGRSTVLVDRREAGEETSFGNAGLIQREGVVPYPFPRDPRVLARIALNQSIDACYHPSALAAIAPYFARYWWHSAPRRHAAIARQYSRLIAHCVAEHDALAAAAGATEFIQRRGWIKLYRSAQERDRAFAEAERWRTEFDVLFDPLDAAALARLEPHLAPRLAGAIHWTGPTSTNDPGGLARAYLAYFERIGGRFVQANAQSLTRDGEHWRLRTPAGELAARDTVVALGPWSDALVRALGYRLPLGVKRGYHMHYRAAGSAALDHVVLDAERGYTLAPMRRGVRLTTGAEFARLDARKTPVQLERAEPVARELFPLAERLDTDPWLGARPCTPDMMPIIGPAPRERHLWFAFGHAHHGLTLGAVTGRLLAELLTGASPFVDPTPYRADRF